MTDFYLVVWKQFENREVKRMSEVIKTDDIKADIDKMKVLNAQKRITTAEYDYYNLTEAFDAHSLEVVEKKHE